MEYTSCLVWEVLNWQPFKNRTKEGTAMHNAGDEASILHSRL
jgi:hypothetical protein